MQFHSPNYSKAASATPQMTLPPVASGFAGRWDNEEDMDDETREPAPKIARGGGGVAIAPPPSLQEPQEASPVFPSKPPPPAGGYSGGSSVAAKIMAKYGFKEGQGLGKQEQGMSMALQVSVDGGSKKSKFCKWEKSFTEYFVWFFIYCNGNSQQIIDILESL